ncbi:m166 protein [Murid betaherpesvirus 1]|uniref:M166 protein n=1 Tax=Murid herpesvirus 1 TaxID=10366 RepID=H2A152_MUHV1|nr:m166 protein [Murid betaherpesvirus 1]
MALPTIPQQLSPVARLRAASFSVLLCLWCLAWLVSRPALVDCSKPKKTTTAAALGSVTQEERPRPEPIKIFLYDTQDQNVIQFSWSGRHHDVRSGFNVSYRNHDDQTVYLGQLDWRGFVRYRDNSDLYVGDALIFHGPPLTDDTVDVYASGWLKLPPQTVGEIVIKGYGQTAVVTVLPPAQVALLQSTDRDTLAPFLFRCLANVRGSTPLQPTLMRWWHGPYPLVSIEWSENNPVEGRVRWEQLPDGDRTYYVNAYTGDIHVFARSTIQRLECLECTMQADKVATSSRLSCPARAKTIALPFDFGQDTTVTPTERRNMDILHTVLIVITWFVAGLGILALGIVLIGNALALLRSCCFPSRSPGAGGKKGGPAYEILVNEETA